MIFSLVTLRLLILFEPNFQSTLEDLGFLLVTMAYLLTSMVILTDFVGKNLKAIELNRKVGVNDYFGVVLELIFWPIGIWSFQQGINKFIFLRRA